MEAIDWIIVALYALVVIGIGIVASRKQNNTDEYFRGSRQLPWWAIGFSLIATSFSAASLLGGPGEGYFHGLLYLQLQLGDLIGYLLVITIFLPFFIQLNLTTAYEYLEQRFDAKNRSLGSLCFILFVIARLGGLLYAASLVVATVTGLSIPLSIFLVGIISIVYTVVGGITAVVWTDVLQFAMILIGLIAGLWAAIGAAPGGFSALWSAAAEAGKFQVINPVWDPESIRALPTALIAYAILVFAVGGTNQQSVQRYVSCADVPSGRNAILLGWFSGLVGVAATLFLGAMLFGFYSLVPGLPSDIAPDKILPHFIVNHVPVGASGLLVAAIFAAAMSSIDSALHSLATTMTVDFYQRYSKPRPTDARSLKVAQWLIVVWGFVGIAAAFFVASIGQSLLPFFVKYTTMFLGPLLGLFLMGILVPRVNATGAFYGTTAAILILVIGTQLNWINIPGLWPSAIVAPLAVILGLVISLLGRVPAPRSLNGLTLWHLDRKASKE